MLGPLFDGAPDELWRRYLALLLDGMRATDRPLLPMTPPTFASLDDMVAAGKRRQVNRGSTPDR